MGLVPTSQPPLLLLKHASTFHYLQSYLCLIFLKMSIPSTFSYSKEPLINALQDLAVRFILNDPEEDVEKPEVSVTFNYFC